MNEYLEYFISISTFMQIIREIMSRLFRYIYIVFNVTSKFLNQKIIYIYMSYIISQYVHIFLHILFFQDIPAS